MRPSPNPIRRRIIIAMLVLFSLGTNAMADSYRDDTSLDLPPAWLPEVNEVLTPVDHANESQSWVNSNESIADNMRVVRSTRLANSPDEAKQQCLDQALIAIAPIFERHARTVYSSPDEIPFDPREAIRVALASGDFTVDEFSQRLQTTDGTDTWRHAMLLDDTTMNRVMVDQNIIASRSRSHRNWRWLSRLGGLIGILVFVSVVYLVLDTVTKGYYAGRITAAIAVLSIVGLALILLGTMR